MPSPPDREFPFIKGSGHRDSIYCLATNRHAHKCQKRPRNRPMKAQKRPTDTGTNSAGSLVVSGSTERVSSHAIGLLRLWDPRSAQKVAWTLFRLDSLACAHMLTPADVRHGGGAEG